MGINLDYFYNNQTERFQFYRIPKVLLQSKYYAGVSMEAKLLYSFMLDRTSLSVKKRMYDENERIYIIYTIEEMQNDLQRGSSSIAKYLKELDNIGLIERKRQGLGKPDLIFLKNFASDAVMEDLFEDNKKAGNEKKNRERMSRDPEGKSPEIQNMDFQRSKIWMSGNPENGCQEIQPEGKSPEIQNMDFQRSKMWMSGNPENECQEIQPESGCPEIQNVDVQRSKKWMSGDPENGSQEIQNVDALNDTDLNDTDLNDTSSSLKTQFKDEEDPDCGSRWRDYIKTQIDYKVLVNEYPQEVELVDKFIDVIINVFTGDDLVRVNSKNKSKNKVVSQLMQLKADHIRNVIQKLKEFDKINSSLSESYILTCLYNSVNVYHVENTGKGKKTGDNSQVISGTKFSNFKERDYDFTELERKFARN